jgi:hypothetical protein
MSEKLFSALSDSSQETPRSKDVFRMGTPGDPTIKRIRSIQEQGGALSQESLPREKDAVKREVYALLAHLIKTTQTNARKIERGRRPGDCVENGFLENIVNRYHLFERSGDTGRLIVDQNFLETLEPDQVIESFTGVRRILPMLFQESILDLKQRGAFGENQDTVIYDRLKHLLYQSNFRARARFRTVESFLQDGINTAMDEVWPLLLVLPVLYQRQYGETLSPETFTLLMPDVKKIVTHMASMQIDVFAQSGTEQAAEAWQDHPTGFQYQLQGELESTLKKIHLHQDKRGIHIDLNEEYMRSLGEKIDQSEIKELRQGCPARDVRMSSDDGRPVSVVSDTVDFYHDLAQDILIPNQDIFRAALDQIPQE